eukprot:TRINITY_DN24180_c0_g1_i2.p1 TRINITY_DN24180_c0_g1~~TRINITY_DN24180_c0_g1_i2.p1  ORF type:complete len:280 (+),score=31.04 TRINITY_DN24180_c0_g1_i2:22-840(+)
MAFKLPTSERTRLVIIVVVALLLLVGFAASVIHIARTGTATSSASGECMEMPKLAAFHAQKQLWSRWHWTYQVGEYDATLRTRCPGFPMADVFYRGQLVARERRHWTWGYVQDCHGNELYAMRWNPKGWNFVWRNFRIYASYVLQEPNDGPVVAYSISTGKGFTDTVSVTDYQTGTTVAVATRKVLSLSAWRWDFTVNNVSHPAGDPRVLLVLAGKVSFETGDSDKSDVCNSYFWGVVWILVALACALFCGLLCLAGYAIKTAYRNGQRCCI